MSEEAEKFGQHRFLYRYDGLRERLDPVIINNLVGLATAQHLAQQRWNYLGYQIDPHSDFGDPQAALKLPPPPQQRAVLEDERDQVLLEKNKIRAELTAVETLAITQVRFTPEEERIVEETAGHIELLRAQFPRTDELQLRAAYRQYLNSFLRYTIFQENGGWCLENVTQVCNDFFAPHLTHLTRSAKVPPEEMFITLQEQTAKSVAEILAASMGLVDQKIYAFSELDEFDPDDFDTNPGEAFRLRKLTWPATKHDREKLIEFWTGLTKEEKTLIYSDATGFEAELALARSFGVTLEEVDQDGKLLAEVLQKVNFVCYREKILVEEGASSTQADQVSK